MVWACVWNFSVFSPFKEEFSAAKETLIKADWYKIPLCLVGSALSVSGCLYKRSSEQHS